MPLTALEEDELAMRVPFAGGDYTIRVQAFNKGRGPNPEPIILTCMVDDTIVTDWKIAAVEAQPGVYEARIGIPEGKHRIAVLNHRIRGGKNELQMRNGRIGAQQPGTIWVKWVELEGPVQGATRLYPHATTAKFTVPKEGDYVLRAEAYAQQAGSDPAKMEFQIDGKPVTAFDVLAPADMIALKGQQVFSTELLKKQPRIYEFRTRLTPGEKVFTAAFTNPFSDPENANPNLRIRNLHVVHLEVAALDEPSPIPPLPEPMRRLLSKKPDARAILTDFATKAWRRPVQPSEVDRLMKLFDGKAPFETAIKQPMKAVLVSPYFLFLGEPQVNSKTSTTAEPISEIALASRLSYFLWSSMPDDELMGLAQRNQLRAHLDVQVKRMLASPKAQALVENFAGQWLEIRNLQFIAPDKTLYPDFDESLRDAMQKETEMFFASIMREDRSVVDFVNGDYTFVNERLARHYGIPNVTGPEFRRVSLEGTPRRGVLTQASVLTLTSNPTRTSPVKRGKWVLEDLLGTPPPPPPPDVPPLKEDAKNATGTLRHQMEEHRANPVCASCHARMDPIGFGLENFDGIGAYRTKEGQFPIDSSGKLTSGESFQGASELSNILATSKRDQFVRCLTEKMMIYALGRGLEYYDRAATDQILKDAEKNQLKFSSLVLGVVKSVPFEQRRAGDAEAQP
jgi:hypothetical protein